MEENILSDVREWYGTSGGSVSAIAGALGVSIGWLRTCVEYFDTYPMIDIQEDLVARFMTEWGVDSGNKYTEYIGKFMDTWEPGSSSWTFSQLSKVRPGILLGIPAVNISTGDYVLFSVKTHPNMRILDAVRASSSIPLFFTPWKDEKGDVYCDGGVKEYFPWSCIPKEKHDSTLLIACHEKQLSPPIYTPIYTLTDYISRIFYFICHHHRDIHEVPTHKIVINDTRLDILDFYQTREERLSLVQSGIDAASAWIKLHSSQGISGIHPSSAPPDTLSSDRMTEPNTASDNPQFQNRPLLPVRFLDSPIASQQTSRRWSL
jgi:predicted acylesterase/phospholipase RssA